MTFCWPAWYDQRYLHSELQVAHGDIYAHNTLVSPDGADVRLGDFGAAFCYRGGTGAGLDPELIQRIEVRAFGVMIDELSSRLAADSPAAVAQTLRTLATECLAVDVRTRPSFSAVSAQLDALLRQL